MTRNISQKTYLLWLAIVLYIAIFFSLCFYKYQNFLYNLEDLSIFNNVLYNTAHGKLFWFSSHGGFSYLGDHLELGLLLLLPIYYFFQSPLTLLFLQTALFALSAWPVYLIAKHFLGQKKVAFLSPPYEGGARGGYEPLLNPPLRKGRTEVWLPLFLTLTFLLNPFLHNINLEEFHVAPLLLFFFLWTFYFYLRKKYRLFLLFFILTLLIREDAALTLGALAVLAAWDICRKLLLSKRISKNCHCEERSDEATSYLSQQDCFASLAMTQKGSFRAVYHILWREKKWWLYPLIISIIWFFASLKIINFFNPDSGYRFLILYQNLNVSNPLTWLPRLFDTKTLSLTIGYLLTFLFLPMFRPKYLFLALPAFLQATLLDAGASSTSYFTHYQIFILAALFLSLSDSLSSIVHNKKYQKYLFLIIGLLIFSQFYISVFLGPSRFLYPSPEKNLTNLENRGKNNKILSLIPPEAKVSGPYRLMPRLSSREKAYQNKLTFLGKKHLALGDFNLPRDTEYLLIDSVDMIEYYLHFQNRDRYSQLYWGGAERMRQTMAQQNFQPIALTDSLLLFKKDAVTSPLPFQITDTLPVDLRGEKKDWGEVEFLGWSSLRRDSSASLPPVASVGMTKSINLYFKPKQPISDDYFFQITALDANQKTLWQKIYPPAYGLLPTHDWPAGKYVMISQILPADPNTVSYQIALLKIKGDIELGPLNDTQLIIDKKEYLGQQIVVEK